MKRMLIVLSILLLFLVTLGFAQNPSSSPLSSDTAEHGRSPAAHHVTTVSDSAVQTQAEPPEYGNRFILLLVCNFIVAFLVCLVVTMIFRPHIDRILHRLVAEDIYSAWSKYMLFAIYVVGISGGIHIWDLEKYISARTKEELVVQLTTDRWILEIYRTIIGTLVSNAWMLLLFFLIALIAFVIIKGQEMKRQVKQG